MIMEELIIRASTRRAFAGVLPETLEEAELLAASIERAVQLETDRGVADLSVEVSPQGVCLKGHCDTYYTKQLAQHAAMRVPGGDRLINSIEVS
jgi:osmotically-inducible protein OsmY